MRITSPGRKEVAAQLGNPHGLFGRLVARQLNSRNRPVMTAAVAALELTPGSTAMDVGFGGGLGLELLLDVVGGSGHVYGVDQSDTAVAAARRTYSEAIAAGRVTVHSTSMTELPLDSQSVDGAMSANTIYFLDDAELANAFAELARVLSSGGRLALGIGDPDAMAKDPLMAHGFRVRPIEAIESVAKAAGLRVSGHSRAATGQFAPHVVLFRKD